MDHIRILRRAFQITWVYRALWVFGILLALTTSRGGDHNGGGGGAAGAGSGVPVPPSFHFPYIAPQVINTMIVAGIALVCVAVLIAIGLAVLRYVSQTALIRMVDGYESSNEKVSVGQGFRLGWSRGAFRLWLVDLVVFLVIFAGFILLLLVAAAPLLLWLTRNNTVGIIGTVITVGLAILFILALIIVVALVSIWVQIVRRVIVLEGQGVFEGMRRGWEMVRRRLGDVIIMGLILFGIGLAWVIVLIPVVLLLLFVGVLAGGLPAVLVGVLVNIFVHGATPAIIAAIVGVPIFLAVLIIPLLFLGGLVETFYSSTWTLTYRELLALETVQPETPETPAAPGPELPA